MKRNTSILLLVIILITVFLAVPAILLYHNVKNHIIKDLGQNAVNIASTIAIFIEEDIEPYKDLSSVEDYIPGTFDEIYYNKMQKLFQKIKKNTDVDFVYTEKQISNTQMEYILDGEDPKSDLFSLLGTKDVLFDYELKSYTRGINVSTDLLESPVWGTFISGFAPIKDNETGEVIGLVGVDYSLQSFNQIINNFNTIVFLVFFIIIVLTSIFFINLLKSLFESLERDYMTGIYSKYYHDRLLKKMIKSSRYKTKPLSLIMIDIDDFKEINDRYGHLTGDKVLKSIARIIQTNTRDEDTCSRYAGDEFVIILPGATKELAAIISQRILEKISLYRLPVEGTRSIHISLSMGIAQWDQKINAETFINCADQAMYISKNTGKNKCTIFNDQKQI